MGIPPSVAFLRHFFSLRLVDPTQCSGCVSFIAAPEIAASGIDFSLPPPATGFRFPPGHDCPARLRVQGTSSAAVGVGRHAHMPPRYQVRSVSYPGGCGGPAMAGCGHPALRWVRSAMVHPTRRHGRPYRPPLRLCLLFSRRDSNTKCTTPVWELCIFSGGCFETAPNECYSVTPLARIINRTG